MADGNIRNFFKYFLIEPHGQIAILCVDLSYPALKT